MVALTAMELSGLGEFIMSKGSQFLKAIIAVVVSLTCLGIIFLVICLKILYPSPISKLNMEDEFAKNKENLLSVAKFLEQQEYISIYITSTSKSGEMFATKNNKEAGEHTHITDNQIATRITDLFEKYKFNVITKKENGVYFQRWSNRDYGRGVVYSLNGERPENALITILEPLSEGNWYFYEEK